MGIDRSGPAGSKAGYQSGCLLLQTTQAIAPVLSMFRSTEPARWKRCVPGRSLQHFKRLLDFAAGSLIAGCFAGIQAL